jgi:hypothetical protein
VSPAAVTSARFYRGVRSAPGYVQVTVNEPDSGWSVPLVPFTRHSPRGFEWGEVCPGAADLARALIIDAVGPAALCEGCNGTRMMVLDPGWNGDPEHEPSRPYHAAKDAALPAERVAECVCGDGIRQLPYRDLEYAVVAQWKGDTWTMTRAAILEELTTFYPPDEVPGWLHGVVTGAPAR